MARTTLRALALGAFLGHIQAAPVDHEIQELPGWKGPLFSKAYAGYIDAGREDPYVMHEHYMFFESEGDPAKDPLLIWTNGGPGASSLFGLFVELGPYYLAKGSMSTPEYHQTGVPSLFPNEYRWTKLGSLLILNSPPPVGFSYCDPAGPSGPGTSCGSWNDTKTAKHNVEFLQNWMSAFPEFSTQDVYIIGESYAGVYVPTLAREILSSSPSISSRLRGFAVGDPCLGGSSTACIPWNGPYFTVQFFYGHNQFSDKTYQEIMSNCSTDELFNGPDSAPCQAALDKMDREKGYAFEYALYDECYDFALSSRSWREPRRRWGATASKRRLASLPRSADGNLLYQTHHMDGAPCGGTDVLPVWVNHSAVKAALHVAPDAFFFDADNGSGFQYNMSEPSLVPFYRHVAEDTTLRVLVYNGDSDPSLTVQLAEKWTTSVGMPEKEAWRPWTLDGKIHVGGFVTRYEGNFDFLTIRGSGHMVPEYKPEAAFTFLSAWLSDRPFPGYNPGPNPPEVVV